MGQDTRFWTEDVNRRDLVALRELRDKLRAVFVRSFGEPAADVAKVRKLLEEHDAKKTWEY